MDWVEGIQTVVGAAIVIAGVEAAAFLHDGPDAGTVVRYAGTHARLVF